MNDGLPVNGIYGAGLALWGLRYMVQHDWVTLLGALMVCGFVVWMAWERERDVYDDR